MIRIYIDVDSLARLDMFPVLDTLCLLDYGITKGKE